MAHEFRMPDIGEGLVEATISSWLVRVGETVAMDQAVVEVETDKAVTEIPTPVAGTLLRHGAAEGDVVAVGAVLFVVGDPDEPRGNDDAALAESAPDSADAAPIVGNLVHQADVLAPRRALAALAAPAPSSASANGPQVHSPLVRRLAQERGVELDRIAGTGPGGRITREDVLRCAADDGGAEPAPASKPAAARGRGEERRPVGRLRSTIAENLSRSWREIPHVTSFYDVDASRLMATRQALAARHDTRIPLDALVIAAVVPALRLYPEFNAKLDGDHLILHHHHDVGIAVDTPEGLVVAVVRDAGARPLLETAAEITRLGELAKQRKLAATDVGRQTFTISNIGAVAGGGHGTPIIPLGTAAILAVGRATDSPVVRDGTLAIAPVMPLSFSYDHRIADGGTARRFMTMVVENLADLSLAVT